MAKSGRTRRMASTTDPEARLYKKGQGKEAKLCFMGHALMENRHGLLVDACLTPADGHAERMAALAMIEPHADRPSAITLGADKAYDAEDFVNELLVQAIAQEAQRVLDARAAAGIGPLPRIGRAAKLGADAAHLGCGAGNSSLTEELG